MGNFCKTGIYVLLTAACLIFSLSGCGTKNEDTVSTVMETEATAAAEPARTMKTGLQTMLILCTDTCEEYTSSMGFRNPNRADFIMLMAIDDARGEISSVQLNPDTVVPFAVPGQSAPSEMPLGEIYSYGSGGSDSCLNMTKAVSSLFGGIRVDHYLTFTKEAVSIVNDMIGGVSVPADISDGNAAEMRILSGTEAVDYFFQRDSEDISNETHMDRQRKYMEGMFQPFMVMSTQNEDFLTKLSLKLGENMGTGLTLSEMLQMFETLSAYSLVDNIVTIPGSAKLEEGKPRYFIDRAVLDTLVNSVYFDD